MKILVSAGEVSGDSHGAYLIRELKKLKPDIYFFGMGSESLKAEGVDVKFDISKRGTIGIFETLPNVIPIYLTFLKMKKLLLEEKPDLVLLIDSQGFNMPFANFCKRHGFKAVYYIAPQEWLWGTARGVKKVVETIDLIISIFGKEHEVYKQAGGNSVYFGHPLLDIVKPFMSREEARKAFIGDLPVRQAGDGRIVQRPTSNVIALCPGSRAQEIRGLLPILLEAGKLIQEEMPDARFLIPAASTNMIKEIFGLIGDFRPKAVVGHTQDILWASDLAICTSGTINLEASILGVPNIMVYKLSPLTYFIGKYILKIGEKLKYFSMPNMLADERVIPELVMGEANPERIAQEAVSILKDQQRIKSMQEGFQKIRQKLGSEGVIAKVAEAILGQFSV